MAHDVFISHSSKDKLTADAVCAGLESRGIRCWIAPRDILPGEEWTTSITNAIASCKVFLLIFSTNSNLSSQVVKEVGCAASDEKTIIPFRIEDIKPTGSMKYYLVSLHWLDALTPPLDAQITRLTDYIAHVLEFLQTGKEYTSSLESSSHEESELDENTRAQKSSELGRKAKNFPKKTLIGKVLAFTTGGIALVLLIIGGVNGWFNPKSTQEPSATVENTLYTPAAPTDPVLPTNTSGMTPTSTSAPPTPTVSYSIGSTLVSPTDGMTMVYVPQGEFSMGNLLFDDQMPVHSVYLDAYWIDQTEVTNAMYKNCTESGDCTVPYNLDTYSSPEYGTYPVEYVSWEQAKAYCEWAGRRLPTEAEWEKAAKGTEFRTYPWGETTPNKSLANFGETIGHPIEVGSYPLGASPYGALDMAGNVAEWVADWYDYYPLEPQNNPQGPPWGKYRVLRGGQHGTFSFYISTTFRMKVKDTEYGSYGFRCVVTE